jgi:hypothetical protein
MVAVVKRVSERRAWLAKRRAAANLQAAVRLRLLPAGSRELEAVSSTSDEEGDPFSRFGDSSSSVGTPGNP